MQYIQYMQQAVCCCVCLCRLFVLFFPFIPACSPALSLFASSAFLTLLCLCAFGFCFRSHWILCFWSFLTDSSFWSTPTFYLWVCLYLISRWLWPVLPPVSAAGFKNVQWCRRPFKTHLFIYTSDDKIRATARKKPSVGYMTCSCAVGLYDAGSSVNAGVRSESSYKPKQVIQS